MAQANDHELPAAPLARMARDLLAQNSVQETLDRIVVHAKDLVDGCEAAGILTVQDSSIETLVASDNVVSASDRIQHELGEGPCFDAAYRHEEVYRIADVTASEKRWPQFVPRARELGIGSIMGFLLFTNTRNNLGALNLYSSQREAFTDRSEQVGWLLASHAAVALSSARTEAQLHEALGTRTDIGEALGIIMERYKLDETAAFDLLTRISQNNNLKIRDLARTIDRTGEVPETP